MTVIAAAIRNNSASVGCDSQVSGSGTKDRITPSKLLAVSGGGSKVFGYLGVTGDAIAIEYLKEVPQPASDSDEDWSAYLDRVSAMLRDKFSSPFSGGARILAVNKTSIHDVFSDGVFRVKGKGSHVIAAVGSGGHVALGSMQASTNTSLPWRPANVVKKALLAAVELAEGCGEPITVHNL